MKKQATIHRLRPLTIAQLKIAAETGQLTPQDLQQMAWIRRAKTIRLPHTAAEQVIADIAAYVRSWRESHNIGQSEFADALQMNRSQYCQIETGIKKTVTIETLMRLADACGAELRFDFIPRPKVRRYAPS